MNYVIENFDNILMLATSIVGTAAIIASMTPTPKDDGIVRLLKKVLDFLAMNVGKAKNADDS